MRPGWVVAIAAAASCYQAPSGKDPCAIQCAEDHACPEGLSCDGRFCHAAGESCHPSFTSVGAGTGFACAIDDKGALWCWGANTHHQIDSGAELAVPFATRVDAGPWSSFDGGGLHACGIKDGGLYCWGANDHGQVSIEVAGDVRAPTAIAFAGAPAQWSSVSAGLAYTCAIGDGRLFCWGDDSNNQLGNAGGGDQAPMEVIAAYTDWSVVATGATHTCAITPTFGLYCWGSDSNGQLGPNGPGIGTSTVPVMVTGLPADAVSVAVADLATCAALADGSVYCWGENAYGELGDLNTTLGMQNQPVLATSTMKFTALAASQHAFCGRRDDGTGASEIDCWGQSVIGGFGDGFWAEQTVTTKQLAKVATGASDLSLGWSSDIDGNNIDEYDLELGCGVFAGDVKCWGDDSYGQLGNGGATLAATPTPVGGPAFATIAIGNEHACGVDMASKLYCWGSTTSGQATGVAAAGTKQKCDGIIDCDVGVPKQITATMTVDQVVAGYDFTCQLLGSVVSCWGDDSVQQLGTSNAGPRPKMVTNPGGMAWTRLIPTGGQLTCGTVGAAGQGYCWGSNPFTGGNSGPVAVNDVTGALQVLLGGLNTVSVVDASHELECQGDNTQGEFGDGTTTNATMLQPLGRFYAKVARSVWSAHACGIAMSDQHVECWGPNGRGQVGDTTGTDPVLSPFTLPQLAACTDVAVSAADSCALCGNTVYCWGDNTRGQLGNGTITTDKQPTPTPVALPGGETWMDLGAGSTFTCVRAASGHVFCWGRGSHGGLGNGGIPANLPSLVRASPM